MIVKIPDLGSVGIIKDQLPHELPVSAFSDGVNVRFKDRTAQRISGDLSIVTDPAVTPYGLWVYRTATKVYLVHAGTAKIYSDDGTTQANITGTDLTGASTDKFTGGVFQGVLILNNGIDNPRYWGGTGNTADVTNWPASTTCKVIRPFKNYLFALDVTKSTTRYASMVKWSCAADPGTLPATWVTTDATKDAGETDLAETSDTLIDAVPLGDSLCIYKQFSAYLATYIGGQFVWQFRRIPGEFGMLAANCGAVTPVGNVVLSVGDVVLNNGQEIKSILTDRMRDWLRGAMDTTNYAASFVVANTTTNEAWICFPDVGQSVCTKALIWNWVTNTFSIRELANASAGAVGSFAATASEAWSGDSDSWDSDTTTWAGSSVPASQTSIFMCTTAKEIRKMDQGTTFDGVDFTSRLERTGLDFGMPDSVKLVRSIYPRIDGTTGKTVYVQVGSAMDFESGYTWQTPVAYTIGSTFKADTFASGRLIGYRLYSTASFSWRVGSVDFDVVPQGMY